jgi:SOS regulatory protein LexA
MSLDTYKRKILSFYTENKRMPGYQEIMELAGFKSKNSVHKLINKLVADGTLDKDEKGRISPKKMFGDIPLLGLVEAGLPTDAEQDELDRVSLEEFIVHDKSDSYLLEVKGDSMIEAHIDEGDYVLVERKGEPREGDIVIAEVDGGWTMKYFRRDKKGRPYLEPANRNYDNIYPEESFRIAAIVRAIIRKL